MGQDQQFPEIERALREAASRRDVPIRLIRQETIALLDKIEDEHDDEVSAMVLREGFPGDDEA
jgi:hypothetical protein